MFNFSDQFMILYVIVDKQQIEPRLGGAAPARAVV
jgi:hypothetical protein